MYIYLYFVLLYYYLFIIFTFYLFIFIFFLDDLRCFVELVVRLGELLKFLVVIMVGRMSCSRSVIETMRFHQLVIMSKPRSKYGEKRNLIYVTLIIIIIIIINIIIIVIITIINIILSISISIITM